MDDAQTTEDLRTTTRQALRAATRAFAALLAATAAFLLVPVSRLDLDRVVIVIVVFLIGLGGVAGLVIRQVVSFRRAESGIRQLQRLLMAVYLTVLFFALAYYLLATTHPGQIADLHTRIDALYFALTIVSTVGFGDVHAQGQAARAITSLQLVFNLVFVSLALSVARAPVVPRP